MGDGGEDGEGGPEDASACHVRCAGGKIRSELAGPRSTRPFRFA